MDKITVFKNRVTQYDVMHCFRKSLSDAFERLGIEVELLDISKMTMAELLHSIYKASPDYTLAFNGLEPLQGGNFLSDELQIPHVAWLVDSAHYFTRIGKGAFNLLISPDQTSADLHKTWGATRSFFLPHGFEASVATPPEKERHFPIVFLGSFIDPIEIQEAWKKSMPLEHVEELVEAAKKVLCDPSLPYQQALGDRWNSLSPADYSVLAMSFDLYVRATDRIELLKSLCGLPVHIFGNRPAARGWEDFLDLKNGDYTLHPAVNFPESIEIMKQAKIVLNSSPMFKTGGHERIFYGLGCGAAVLTNRTTWIMEHYKENEEILLYNSKEKIEELLSSPGKLVEIAQKGQEKALKNETWDARAKSLLEIMQQQYETFT